MSPEQVVSLGCTNVLCSELPMKESSGQQRGKQYTAWCYVGAHLHLSVRELKEREVETQGASD